MSLATLPQIGRWIATVYTALFVLILLLEALAGGAGEIEEEQEWEAFAIGSLAAAAVVAVAFCWRRPHRTLPLMLAVGLLGVVIGLVTAGRNHWIAATVSGGPYLLAAALAWLGARGISGSAGPID